MDGGIWQAVVHGVAKESDTTERLSIGGKLFERPGAPYASQLGGVLGALSTPAQPRGWGHAASPRP